MSSDIAERNGYELRTRLIELLNSDGVLAGKRYRLKITTERVQPGHCPAERRHHHALQQPDGSQICAVRCQRRRW